MERDPYSLLEGLAIAAYAVGATEAVIAVRAEYPGGRPAARGGRALGRGAGYLGVDTLGSGWDLTVTIRTVQGAYMLGEETVLLKALEGKRGQPEQRPPHPAERGLFGNPTIVQNIATLVAVPWILVKGAEAFRAIGAPDAPGTVLVQVSGAARSGIAEVPTGTTLQQIVAARRWRPERPSAEGGARRRVHRAGCCRRPRSIRRTTSRRCARPAPTWGRAPSSSRTNGHASSIWPDC